MSGRHAIAAVVVLASLVSTAPILAQRSAAPTGADARGTISDLTGTWQGTLPAGPGTLRIGLIVSQSDGGELSATLISVDQDGARIPVQKVVLTGTAVHLDLPGIKASYDGTLDAGRQAITGSLVQAMPVPLNFKRVSALDPSPTFSEKESADVRAVINEYFRAFTAKDFDAFRGVFQPPYVMWGVGGSPNVFTSLDDIVTRYSNLRNSLDPTDYAVSKAVRMTITPLSANTAMVDTHWRRDEKDGSLFGEGGEILFVLRTPTGWKITGNIGRQLSQYGKSF